MGQLALAMVLFLASHSLTTAGPARRGLERGLGRKGFRVLYSLLSLALLAWIVVAVRAAPVVPVWTARPWMIWAPPVAMAPACILAVAGLTTPNPFSLGPGARGYDADRPGILRLTRHPVLAAAALWAGRMPWPRAPWRRCWSSGRSCCWP